MPDSISVGFVLHGVFFLGFFFVFVFDIFTNHTKRYTNANTKSFGWHNYESDSRYVYPM